MKENTGLKPSVRVYLSSTFADMHNEREYYHRNVVPRLSELCRKKGLPFYAVDLRDGIAEEEEENGRVFPLCITEIDRCRPFFIGILGNRYGCVPGEFSAALTKSMPWLEDCRDKSITEIEMYYGVLRDAEPEERDGFLFLLRSRMLSEEFYPNAEALESEKDREALHALKETITDRFPAQSFSYSSLEEFGNEIVSEFSKWLGKAFPDKAAARAAAWNVFEEAMKKDYCPTGALDAVLSHYVASGRTPLLVHGEAALGKTALLNNYSPKDHEKILINIGADDAFRYWPSVARQIIIRLKAAEPSLDFPEADSTASYMYWMTAGKETDKDPGVSFFVTDAEREDFRKRFVSWMESLSLTRDIVIMITGLDLLEDPMGRSLNWFPVTLPEHLHLIASADDAAMAQLCRSLGWNTAGMPTLTETQAEMILEKYCGQAEDAAAGAKRASLRKGLTGRHKKAILASSFAEKPGMLRLILRGMEEADGALAGGDAREAFLRSFSDMHDDRDLWLSILDETLDRVPLKEAELLRRCLALVWAKGGSLTEEECRLLSAKGPSKQDEISGPLWAGVYGELEVLGLLSDGVCRLQDRTQKAAVRILLEKEYHVWAHDVLGEYCFAALKAPREEVAVSQIRSCTENAKEAIRHFADAEKWEKLAGILTDPDLLNYLVRLDWDHVRAGWCRILLSSDLDVVSCLLYLMDQYRTDRTKEGQLILKRVTALVRDLGLMFAEGQAMMHSGLPRIPEDLMTLPDPGYSDAFREVQDLIRNADRHGDAKQVERLCREALSRTVWNDGERTRLYQYLQESERSLSLYKELLADSDQYLSLALKTGSLPDISEAGRLRGAALLGLSRSDEAEETLHLTEKLSLCRGDLTTLLSCRNMRASLYREEEREEEALELYRDASALWLRLRNTEEAAADLMNYYETLLVLGREKEAEEAGLYAASLLENAKSSRGSLLRFRLENDLGRLYLDHKDYEKAEDYLIRSYEDSKTQQAGDLHLSLYRNLLRLYQETDRSAGAVDIYDLIYEFMLEKQDPEGLADIAEEEIGYLSERKYDWRAREVRGRTISILKGIPEAADLVKRFETEEDAGAFGPAGSTDAAAGFGKGAASGFDPGQRRSADILMIENLKGQLSFMVDTGNRQGEADCLMQLAMAMAQESPEEAIRYYGMAARVFASLGSIEFVDIASASAAALCMESPRDEHFLENCIRGIHDEDTVEIADLWLDAKDFAYQAEEDPDCENDFVGVIMNLAGLIQDDYENGRAYGGFRVLSGAALTTLAPDMRRFLRTGEICSILDAVSMTDFYGAFCQTISRLYSEGLDERIHALTAAVSGKTPAGSAETADTGDADAQADADEEAGADADAGAVPESDAGAEAAGDGKVPDITEEIEDLDGISKILERSNPSAAAVLLSSIASILRKYRDEGALEYHEQAMKIYKELEMENDYLIESINMATTQKELRRTRSAIETLMQALNRARTVNNRQLQGAIAGNLAATLMQRANEADSRQPDADKRARQAEEANKEIRKYLEMEEHLYRDLNDPKNLAAALLDQVRFYLERGGSAYEDAAKKFEEAEQLIRTNNIADLRQRASGMGKLLWKIGQIGKNVSAKWKPREEAEEAEELEKLEKAEEAEESEDPEKRIGEQILRACQKERMNLLLSGIAGFEGTSPEFDERGILCAALVPSFESDIPLVSQKAEVFVGADNIPEIEMKVEMKPASEVSEEAMTFIREYAAWWNDRQAYPLEMTEAFNDSTGEAAKAGTLTARVSVRTQDMERAAQVMNAALPEIHKDACILSDVLGSGLDIEVAKARKLRKD